MCLYITVRLSDADANHAGEVAQLASTKGGMELRGHRKLIGRDMTKLHISERNNGCACSMLTEKADWDAETWDMHPNALQSLALTVRALRQKTTRGFTFEALWQGEKAEGERRVSIDELAQIIDRGQIGTKTLYLVD